MGFSTQLGSAMSQLPSVRSPWTARNSLNRVHHPVAVPPAAASAAASCSGSVRANSASRPALRASAVRRHSIAVGLHDLRVARLDEPGDVGRVDPELGAQPAEPEVEGQQRVHHLEVDLERAAVEGPCLAQHQAEVCQRGGGYVDGAQVLPACFDLVHPALPQGVEVVHVAGQVRAHPVGAGPDLVQTLDRDGRRVGVRSGQALGDAVAAGQRHLGGSELRAPRVAVLVPDQAHRRQPARPVEIEEPEPLLVRGGEPTERLDDERCVQGVLRHARVALVRDELSHRDDHTHSVASSRRTLRMLPDGSGSRAAGSRIGPRTRSGSSVRSGRRRATRTGRSVPAAAVRYAAE